MLTDVVQRWTGGRPRYRPADEVIATHRYEVAPIDDDTTARRFVCANHYSGTYPAARFRMGLYASGGDLEGVAVFSVPMNEAALSAAPGDRFSRVELGRFVLSERVPGNGESWFLARCFALLRQRGITGVVSFSDPVPRTTATGEPIFQGHVGTIYQATNAVYLGRATARTLRLLPDGKAISARTIQKIRSQECGWRYAVDQLVAAGAPPPDGPLRSWLPVALQTATRPLRHAGNFRYAWAMNPRDRRHMPKSLTYPKFVVGPTLGQLQQ